MKKQQLLLAVLAALGILTVSIWIPIFQGAQRVLTVSFLEIGQGDAVYIETPSGRQILIDGGAHGAVLRELSSVIPWFDRSLDMVIATHPDTDHIGGLVEVLDRYAVEVFVHADVTHDAPAAQRIAEVASNTQQLIARRGQYIDFGDGVGMSILFPDRDVDGVDINDSSIVLQIHFGEHDFLLTGDASDSIEEYLVALDEDALRSTVLKAGHHGSDTSSSSLFLGFVDPEYAVISRGCDNRYGHPHAVVLERLREHAIEILDTCLDGRITFTSDGTRLHVKSSR